VRPQQSLDVEVGMRVRTVAGVAVVCVVGSVGVVPWAGPAGAVSAREVVADGLDEPYKLSFSADGDLYVAEAGRGGTEPCFDPPPGPDGDPAPRCLGATGAVTKVVGGDGAQTRALRGLPSISDGEETVGPTDVVMADDGSLLVTIGLGGNVNTRAAYGPGGAGLGTVMRGVTDGSPATVFADLAAFEAEEDPDAEQPDAEGVGEGGDSNPFGSELVDGTLYVVDAGGNTLLRVGAEETELVSLFPFETTPAPPFLGAPPGTMIPYQPVPTSVAQGPDGALRVGELTGFPFPVGGADVYRVPSSGEEVVEESGFTHIMDVAYDDDGNLYVAQLSRRSLLEGPPVPAIVQVRPDGSRKTLLDAGQLGGAPTGIAVGPDGQLYVSLGLAGAGNGQVVRFDPSVAGDPAIAPACPPDLVPGTAFTDIGDSVHREAIECLFWREVVNGVTADRFDPGRAASRGAVATMLAAALAEAGVDLPASPPDAFTDDTGSTHEPQINQLAELGVVKGFDADRFGPTMTISRAQLATMLVQAYEELFQPLDPGSDAFTDDDGSVHEANIDAAAEAGWVTGRTATTFEPDGSARRDQVASMVARLLGTLVADEEAGATAG
jgi:hypothetical protein